MSEKTVRVGVIGAGNNTRSKHIPGLQAIDGVEVVGVCNRSAESSRRVADEFKIPGIYDVWTDVITDPGVDAVVIGTWPYLHAPATLAALAAGKHVLCEARMAMDATQARAMRDASLARPHLIAQVVPSPFTLRVDRTIQRLLAEGFTGKLLAVEVRVGGSFLDADSPLTWRQQTELSGVNIMGLGIWYEALLRWIGPANRVVAMGKVSAPMRPDASGRMRAVRIPDHLDVIADMACGAQLHLQMSAVTGLAGGPDIFLFGTDGTLRLTSDVLSGARKGDKELIEIPIPPHELGHWRVEEEFINAIRGKEAITHTTFQDGVLYMDFTEAVARSIAARGEPVVLPVY
jgi:predicted dehydrogenase